MLPFYTPEKYQKTKGFLVFLGDIKWEHWPEKINEFVPMFQVITILANAAEYSRAMC